MFDIQSFYEAKNVKDAINALVSDPNAELISGGTDELLRVREGRASGVWSTVISGSVRERRLPISPMIR